MRLLLVALLLATPLLAGCTLGAPQAGTPGAAAACDPGALPREEAPRGNGETVTLLTHDSFTLTDDLVAAFQNETGYALQLQKMGDAGEALNKAILTRDAPLGDVLFGVDNVLIHRARAHDLFAPYAPAALADVPTRFVDPFCRGDTLDATPVSYGYVALNVDEAWMEARGIPLPDDLRDLANATYAPLTVVEHPVSSSPGNLFFLATVATLGTEGDDDFRAFWADFARNGGRIVPGWEDAYGSWFTQGWDDAGARDRPIVVSYATSPAFNPMMGYTEGATSALLDLPGSSWLQVETAGLLRNAPNPDGGKALISFLLREEFQASVPELFVTYPVVPGTPLPPAYAQYAAEPASPAHLDAAVVEENRDAWLAEWREATGMT